MEGADEVLAERRIDRRLAADAGIDLRQQAWSGSARNRRRAAASPPRSPRDRRSRRRRAPRRRRAARSARRSARRRRGRIRRRISSSRRAGRRSPKPRSPPPRGSRRNGASQCAATFSSVTIAARALRKQRRDARARALDQPLADQDVVAARARVRRAPCATALGRLRRRGRAERGEDLLDHASCGPSCDSMVMSASA